MVSSVTPPACVYSPAESVVGMAMWIEVAAGQERVARHLACVNRASAAETDQAVAVQPRDFRFELAHHASRDVLPRALEHRRATRAQRSSHFFEHRGTAQRLSGDHDGAFQPAAFELLTQRGDFSRPRDHALKPA